MLHVVDHKTCFSLEEVWNLICLMVETICVPIPYTTQTKYLPLFEYLIAISLILFTLHYIYSSCCVTQHNLQISPNTEYALSYLKTTCTSKPL